MDGWMMHLALESTQPTMLPSAIRRAITRSHLSSLQSAYASTASSFQSYNFREYFERVANRKFNIELQGIIGQSPHSDGDLLELLDEQGKQALKKWWETAHKDLETWKRSSVVNNLFIAPKLVVEGAANLMSAGGGGAGMEQAAGGAGQPVNPDKDD
jgi:hypothetical protein